MIGAGAESRVFLRGSDAFAVKKSVGINVMFLSPFCLAFSKNMALRKLLTIDFIPFELLHNSC